MPSSRSHDRRALIERLLAHDLQLRGEAMLEGEDFESDALGEPLPHTAHASLPAPVAAALVHLKRRYDDDRAGSTRVISRRDAHGDFFVLHTTTDGDDGYVCVFDAAGDCDGAARTLLELCEWNTLEATLALLSSSALPPGLAARRSQTLWNQFLRRQR